MWECVEISSIVWARKNVWARKKLWLVKTEKNVRVKEKIEENGRCDERAHISLIHTDKWLFWYWIYKMTFRKELHLFNPFVKQPNEKQRKPFTLNSLIQWVSSHSYWHFFTRIPIGVIALFRLTLSLSDLYQKCQG